MSPVSRLREAPSQVTVPVYLQWLCLGLPNPPRGLASLISRDDCAMSLVPLLLAIANINQPTGLAFSFPNDHTLHSPSALLHGPDILPDHLPISNLAPSVYHIPRWLSTANLPHAPWYI